MRKPLQTIFLSLFFLLFVANQSSLALAEVTNLVAGETYTSNPAANDPYGDSGTKLTDAAIAELTPTAQGWVGYGFGEPVITFHLDAPSEISEVKAHFLEETGWGIHYPQAVEVQTSNDGTTWASQGTLAQGTEYFELQLSQVEAEYIRLLISRVFWTFISEIEIYGEAIPPTPPTPETLEGVLFLTSTPNENNESYNRMINTLDGLGLPYDVISDEQITSTSLTDYQLVIVDGTSFELLDIDLQEEEHIVASIGQGVNYLWTGAGIWGSFQTTNLPNAFGLQYVEEGTSQQFGVTEGEFTDLTGKLTKFPVFNEYIRKVQPTQAAVEGWYYAGNTKQDFPLATKYSAEGQGTTVYVSLPLLDFWKSTEAEYTYARTEMLTKYIRQLTEDGYVGLHPAKNGKEATFLLRLEDYTPGGTFIDHSTPDWLDRMERLLEFTLANQLPLNIALIPLYAHPFLQEEHTWSETTQQIPLLKEYALDAVAGGGSLIVHGYKHQNGSAEDDYSGDDWEMWNEDTEQYLSLEEQQEVTDLALAEAGTQFGYSPTIWETPHYISDSNTYLATKNSGFTFFTESDTKLFPNQRGYLNKSNGNLWNIPETAFDFPEDNASIAALEPIKIDHILPRLARLNAPYYIFYHNNLDAQLESLSRIVGRAQRYNMWFPGMEEFGNFWLQREQAIVTTLHDQENQAITASVSNSFEGLTLAVRLPNGMQASTILVNGAPQKAAGKFVDGIWYAYPVMPSGISATVELSYTPFLGQMPGLHWMFDEQSGTVAYDSSLFGNAGTAHRTTWAAGKNNGALSFNGEDSYVETHAGVCDQLPCSFTGWFNASALEVSRMGIFRTNQSELYAGVGIFVSNTGELLVRLGDGAGDGVLKRKDFNTVPGTITAGNWYHYAVVANSINSAQVHINGEQKSLVTQGNATAWRPGIGKATIGRGWRDQNNKFVYFNGLIDDVRSYNRALSSQEIASLAQ